MIDWKTVWTITIMLAFVIGGALYFFFPQHAQSSDVINQWETSVDQGVIIVVYVGEKNEAINEFKKDYPNYIILEVFYKDGRTYIKAKRGDEK